MQLMRYVLFIGGMMVFTVMCAACSRQEEKKPVEAVSPHNVGVKKETTVVVPAIAKGKWRSVMVGVTDKQLGKESVYEVPVGSRVSIPGSALSIQVDNFLPHFIMQGPTLTSESNELKNPAAQIRVYEGEKEIFKGWLFALYPTTHAFQHPRYGFTLKDFVPAK